MPDCANCQHLEGLRRELDDHKIKIGENNAMILQVKNQTERLEERENQHYDQLLSIVKDIKISVVAMAETLQQVTVDTALNTQRSKFSIEFNWKTISAILLGLSVVVTPIINKLIDKLM